MASDRETLMDLLVCMALKHRRETAAEQVVARMDTFSQEEHAAGIEAARKRAEAKRAARRERAAAAAARLCMRWASVTDGDLADAILASDWLRERDRRIRSVVGKEIAEAIESRYLGPDSGRLPDGRDAPDAAQRNAYDEGLELAARIAHRASRGIGGGA